jgi:serine/threonine protein kinase
VAVKELRFPQVLTPEKFQKIAKNESVVLKRFKEQGHPHLIRALAHYTQDRRHCFIFPWAKRGNLRDFWNSQPSLGARSPTFSFQNWVSYLSWFFAQLVGLAEAIKCLHYPPGTSAQQENKSAQSCRHGDFKPENVLCFGNQEPGLGNIPTDVKLVITDAGHAKVHETATKFRAFATTTAGGTLLYSPPEAEIRPKDARTRRYDIWSLGCLYLEFLIWTLYGKHELEEFHHVLKGSFYEKVPVPALKTEVKDWIEAIREDPRCAPAEQTALGRLVDLIEYRLLVVNVVIRRSDSNLLGNDTGDTTRRDTSAWAENPFVMVTPATIPVSSVPERADSIEICEEMNKIFAAAEKEASLDWINWDGIEEAATRVPPQISSYLTNDPRRGSVTARNTIEFTPGVRYRVPLKLMDVFG